MLRIFFATILACAAALPVAAQAPAAASAERREAFEAVWRTVNESHFDPTFGGLDWAAVGERYRPLAASARSDAEFHEVLRRMVGELKLSHFAIYPSGALGEPEGPSGGPAAPAVRGASGLDVRVIEGRAVVTRVAPRGAAARAGLRTGFVIQKVDGRDITATLARLTRLDAREGRQRAYLQAAVAQGALAGPAGAARRVTYLGASGRAQTTTVTLLPAEDEMSEPLGNFPAMPTQFETRRFGEVGYVRFNIWVVSQMEKLRRGVRELSDTRALVFDLRGNPGGLGIMAVGLAGLLSREEFSLGTMMQRRGHMNFLVNPQPAPYNGAVVVLVDGLSASTSEIFALGLQEAGRAAVVGETTAGAALPSIFARLPTGATFQFAFADFKTPQGVRVEGRGVVPDFPVKLDRRSLLAGRDPQLDAALRVARDRAARAR